MRNDLLHIIVPHFNLNKVQAHKRLRLEFLERYKNCGAPIYVVELALGEHGFEVTDPDNPRHLQIRTHTGVPWIKENLINLGIRKLIPQDAKYVAWVDGDITFMNPNWVQDTLRELQHAPVLQMFSECIDIGPSSQAVPGERGQDDYIRESFGKVHVHKNRIWNPNEGYTKEHCGFAWAARLSFLKMLDHFNPLIDYSVVGSADWQMACCFSGHFEKAYHGNIHSAYRARIESLFKKCELHLGHDLSYIPGLITHGWHGNKKNRKYISRWQMLIDHKFDPDVDLVYREDGLLHFSGRNKPLELALRDHSRSKNEDSIDT